MFNTESTRKLFSIRSIIMIMGLMSLLIITGCNSTTEADPTGIMAGTIQLVNDINDPDMNVSDFSGVAVSVYNATVLDSSIARINEQHPGIGINIDQETEFDHRLVSPVAKTLTSASGQFRIEGLPFGVYNVAIFKEDWAVKYIYSVEVLNSSQVTLPDVELHPARQLSGYMSNSFSFEDGETYIVNNSITFVAPVTLNTGARIYVDQGAFVTFGSSVSVAKNAGEESYWRFDSSRGLYSNSVTVIDSTQYFPSVKFQSAVPVLSNGLFRHVSDGVLFYYGKTNISDIDIKHFNSAITFNNEGGSIQKSIIRNGGNKAMQCLSQTGAISVTKSIVFKTYDGVVAYMAGGFTIEDNYFYETDTAIRPQNCSGSIRHNNFYSNRCDILQYNASSIIEQNNFYFSKSVGVTPRTFASINGNNFYKTNAYFINIRRTDGTYSYVHADVNATGNYWATSEIDRYILDGGDNINYPGQECPYVVNYLPKSSIRIATAGIRNNG